MKIWLKYLTVTLMCFTTMFFSYAQNIRLDHVEDQFSSTHLNIKIKEASLNSVNLFDYSQVPYSLDLISFKIRSFYSSFNMSIEEEPEYVDGLNIVKEFAFLDYTVNYTLKSLTISMFITNIFNLTDFAYAVEVDMIDNNLVFIHEQDSSIGVSIAYVF